MHLDFEQFGSFPAVVRPAGARQDAAALAEWIADGATDFTGLVTRYGALLFRGFGVSGPGAFEAVCRAGTPELIDYAGGGSPRRHIAGNVYSSTEYPAGQLLPMHCEYTYFEAIPSFIWFCCETPAASGGETPIGDMQRVLSRLDPGLVERFSRRGIRYIYNLHGGAGFGRGWKEAFGSDDPGQVSAWLDARGAFHRWMPDGTLHVQLRGPGLRTHGRTGVTVWGNQAVNWHVAGLPDGMGARMRRVYGDDLRLPKHATFGDGEPIGEDDIQAIIEVLKAEEVAFRWERGDVMVCDNQRVAHGRRPFTGERRVNVALA